MTRFYAKSDVVVCQLNGGAALLDLTSSKYFSLNSTAALLWERLGEGPTAGDLVALIAAHYDIASDRCAGDVARLLEQLAANNLILSEDGPRDAA